MRTREIELTLADVAAAAPTSAITIPTRLTKVSSRNAVDTSVSPLLLLIPVGSNAIRHCASARRGDTTIHSVGQSTDTVLNIRSIPARVNGGGVPTPHIPDAVASLRCIRSRVCAIHVCVRVAMGSDNSFERAKDEVQESCYRDCCHR